MPWIDEMFAGIRQAKDTALERRNAEHSSSVDAVTNSEEQISDARDAWSSLISVMRNDVNEFNNNKSRGRQNPVLMTEQTLSLTNFHFEVYLPEMHSKLLVLTLEGGSLHIIVRPDYPDQRSTITLVSAKNSQHYCWVLREPGEAIETVTVQQLSERLLKPILSSAEID
jgi:hypothetical protein